MKKTTIIVIVVLVFIVVAIVVYMFTKSNRDASLITRTTETSGLGNIFANTGGGWLSSLFTKNGSQAPSTAFNQQNAQQVQANVAGTITSMI